MLAHTLGFVGIDNQGLAGLENYYEEVLNEYDNEKKL